jgi:hypothetical protein
MGAYRPPAWRRATSAAKYVAERVKQDRSLSRALETLSPDAVKEPLRAIILRDPHRALIAGVERARIVHPQLERELWTRANAEAALAAVAALEGLFASSAGVADASAFPLRALEMLEDAEPGRVSGALGQVKRAVEARLRVARHAHALIGANRKTGGRRQEGRDKAAARFGVGEMALHVYHYWRAPYDETVATIGQCLFGGVVTAQNVRRWREATRASQRLAQGAFAVEKGDSAGGYDPNGAGNP